MGWAGRRSRRTAATRVILVPHGEEARSAVSNHEAPTSRTLATPARAPVTAACRGLILRDARQRRAPQDEDQAPWVGPVAAADEPPQRM